MFLYSLNFVFYPSYIRCAQWSLTFCFHNQLVTGIKLKFQLCLRPFPVCAQLSSEFCCQRLKCLLSLKEPWRSKNDNLVHVEKKKLLWMVGLIEWIERPPKTAKKCGEREKERQSLFQQRECVGFSGVREWALWMTPTIVWCKASKAEEREREYLKLL